MADSRIKTLADATAAILMATDAFQSGTAFEKQKLGKLPSFGIWFRRFTQNTPERRADQGLTETTFIYEINLYCTLGASEQVSQEELWVLIQAVRNTLADNSRLGVSGVLRSRVVAGDTSVVVDKENAKLEAAMLFEVDWSGIW